ncbi:type VII secretion-associated serine protease mycosin [Dactylosporangium fulvum]|uniref:S8 family serine peptidase n=1 Tax=Dactylosporangium fulvum TaxID=53359 RepID=A0ABY5W1B4_9ACTN|nr:S8 family serine peptidase [Dactylosporangium fulvum]UWP83732.1 S8 family serine peptidase [Dactylosporangium fulvum]
MISRRVVLTAAVVVLLSATTPSKAAHADSVRNRQWHLQFLNAAAAHTVSQGDGVLVGVADTGVDPRSAEMASAVIVGGEFDKDGGDGRTDTDGHGTAMAALIAARGKNGGDGALGIAPKSTILPLRVFTGDPAALGAGISWAVDHGAKVISISLSTSEEPTIEASVQKALAADVVVIAGVGNTPNEKRVAYPARLPGVLAVGGVDRQGNHAGVSVTGPEVMIAAPAVDILSIGASQRYRTATGTSDATAIVAGAAALVRSKYPQLSGPEVVRRLTATAQDRGAPGRDDQYGYGVLDLVAALTADVPPASAGAPVASTTAAAAPKGDSRGGRGGMFVAVAGVLVAVVFVFILLSRRRRAVRPEWNPRPLPPPIGRDRRE